MSERPSAGVGQRIAEYRRLAGLSARELADRAGVGLTRGVIANLESGRKSDLTVDQLLAIAYVIGVPPVVIVLPVQKPFYEVAIAGSEGEPVYTDVWSAVSWFETGRGVSPRTPASAIAMGRLLAVGKYLDHVHGHQDFTSELDELKQELRSLQVDISGPEDEVSGMEKEAGAKPTNSTPKTTVGERSAESLDLSEVGQWRILKEALGVDLSELVAVLIRINAELLAVVDLADEERAAEYRNDLRLGLSALRDLRRLRPKSERGDLPTPLRFVDTSADLSKIELPVLGLPELPLTRQDAHSTDRRSAGTV